MAVSRGLLFLLAVVAAQPPTQPADEIESGHAILQAVRDGGNIDVAPLIYMLDRAMSGELDAMAPSSFETARYGDFTADPERLRGRAFRVSGRLMQWAPLEVEGLPSELRRAVKGELVTSDREVYTVVLAEPPPTENEVQVRGWLLKIWTYEDRRGRLHNVPVLVARQATPIVPPESAAPGVMSWVAAGVVLAAIAAVAWVWLRELARPPRRRPER